MILELSAICKDYIQDKLTIPVLKNVSLYVMEGEYVAIMGPSGSGKTTLMNIIGCLDVPTSGSYHLAGKNVLKRSDAELAAVRRNQIGFVFQNFNLMPRETALENVALPLIYAGIKKQERLKMAAEALKRVGLEDRMNFLPTQLSGGQKQRVAIARAMVNNPRVLLADEPTGALDSKSGAQIMELFQQLNDEGVTIVMITHDPKVAARAKRVMNIIDGEISGPDCPIESIDDILQEAGGVTLGETVEETNPNAVTAEEEIPTGEETPAEEEIPVEEKIPAEEEIPAEEKTPAEEEIPAEGETPAEEEIPIEEETPAEEGVVSEESIQEDVAAQQRLISELKDFLGDEVLQEVKNDPETSEIPEEGGLDDEE